MKHKWIDEWNLSVSVLSCGSAHLDVQPDHPDFHARLLPAAHAGDQRSSPAHRLASAQGEDDDRGGQQV